MTLAGKLRARTGAALRGSRFNRVISGRSGALFRWQGLP